MDEAAELLAGGHASGAVIRIGATVRKPWTDATPGVVEFMLAVRAAGVDVPDPMGRDKQGRQVVEYVPGQLAQQTTPLDLRGLTRVGKIIRAIYDASEGFSPSGPVTWDAAVAAPGAELICHNDLAPWNLVVGDRWVFIDWDAAAPSTRLWDLAYAAQAFTLQDTTEIPEQAGRRLRALVDGYQADSRVREALPQAMVDRAAAMHDLLKSSHASGREPWGSMYLNGHGSHWASVHSYTDENRDAWSRALAIS